MNEKLKPCPFCGGEAELIKIYNTQWHYVQCVKCKVKTEHKTEQEAINAWNTRVKE